MSKVTICGSMRFMDTMKKKAMELRKEGYTVLEPVYDIGDKEVSKLKQDHLDRIKASDAIYVVNVYGYLGQSVKIEIEYAKALEKEIMYLESKVNMSKVIIGVVGKHTTINKVRTNTLIRDEIKQALFDNDAVCIGILSPDEIMYCEDDWEKSKIKQDQIMAQINLCDGIILQGGTASEAWEVFAAKYCYENDIPCLGICAGENNMVRALGGTTYEIPNPDKHDVPDKDYVHSININENSKFYSIVNKTKIMVNSRHKRDIKTSPFLDKVAFCDDGYADVVEAKNKRFYIGVRFHPESLYKIDENMNNIFVSFIEACR